MIKVGIKLNLNREQSYENKNLKNVTKLHDCYTKLF